MALEERLRQACPGSILPPRPDKHATRALEEASTQQSAEFAVQRARELKQYLNALAQHPVAGQSQVLRLFLGLQDDIDNRYFIRKVLEEGTASSDALANRLSDTRYKDMAEAFGFGPGEVSQLGSAGFADDLISRYQSNGFEVAAGAQDGGENETLDVLPIIASGTQP